MLWIWILLWMRMIGVLCSGILNSLEWKISYWNARMVWIHLTRGMDGMGRGLGAILWWKDMNRALERRPKKEWKLWELEVWDWLWRLWNENWSDLQELGEGDVGGTSKRTHWWFSNVVIQTNAIYEHSRWQEYKEVEFINRMVRKTQQVFTWEIQNSLI